MVRLNVGDNVVLCATLRDFCGSVYQFLMIGDINISLPPCSYVAFPQDCMEHSGINISFGWTIESSPGTNTCPTMLSGVLRSATTNDQGIASVQYKITQQDLDLYNANPTSFDLTACITNSPPTVHNGTRREFRSADPIIIGPDPCIDSPCKNLGVVSECFGPDMWWVKCDATGACVQDVLRQANHPVCLGATHVLEIPIKPYSWYTPQSAADDLITKMNDINGAIMNAMSFLTGWSYIQTVISIDENYVYLRVYLRENILTLTWGNIALIVVPLAIIISVVGTIVISAIKWGTSAAPGTGLTNGELTSATDKYIKNELQDCIKVKCPNIEPPLTQDQMASCIKVCTQNELENLKGLLDDILPGVDITPLDTGITNIQNCYDIYNSSGKSEADYIAVSECMGRKGDEAVTATTTNITIIYPPDAPAGVTADELAVGDCWIESPIGGCILTAKTGKTVVTIGAVAIGAYVIFLMIKR